MNVAYTLNGKCFDPANAVYCEIADGVNRPINFLSLIFDERSRHYRIAVCITGLLAAEEGKEVKKSKHHRVAIDCIAKNIKNFRSYPLPAGTTLPSDFNAPDGYITTENEPKRIIYFQATRFKICRASLPELATPDLQSQMSDIVNEVLKCQQTRQPLNFICIVNEYRQDRATFTTLQAALEQDKRVDLCRNCQRPGHHARDCEWEWCKKCRVFHEDDTCEICQTCKRGHRLGNCPRKKAEEAEKWIMKFCYWCSFSHAEVDDCYGPGPHFADTSDEDSSDDSS
jgi:hypothetical protein